MKSQSQRILAVLNDNRWHTVAEIHRRAGFSRLNSRVAELRARGYGIECEHVSGHGRGSEAYRYRLVSRPAAEHRLRRSLKEAA